MYVLFKKKKKLVDLQNFLKIINDYLGFLESLLLLLSNS